MSTLKDVPQVAVAMLGVAALAAWVAGVSGLFGVTTNWTLFVTGLVLLLVSRAFALRAPRR